MGEHCPGQPSEVRLDRFLKSVDRKGPECQTLGHAGEREFLKVGAPGPSRLLHHLPHCNEGPHESKSQRDRLERG